MVTALALGLVTLSRAQGDRVLDVVVGLESEPLTLDLSNTESIPARSVALHVTETLLKRDPQFRLITSLAAARPRRVSAELWEVVLRKDVKFHDGSDLTADSVKASLDRLRTEKLQGSAFFSEIDSVEVRDRVTIRIKTKGPDPILPDRLALPYAVIYPAAWLKARTTSEIASEPVGTGPFRWDRWIKGERIALKQNADYWAGRPELASLVFKILPGAAVRAAALASGEVHFAPVPPELVTTIARNPKIVVLETPSIVTVQLLLAPDGPLRDKRVRQALANTIDVEATVKKVFDSGATPVGGLANRVYMGFDAAARPERPDPAAAARRLAEAGMSSGVKLSVLTPATEQAQSVVRALGETTPPQARIAIEPNPKEFAAYFTSVREKKFGPAALVQSLSQVPDAAVLYHRYYHSKGALSPWSIPRLDEAIDRALTLIGTSDGARAYIDMERVRRDEVPGIPLYQPRLFHGRIQAVRGFVRPDGVMIVQAGPSGSCDCDTDADCCKTQKHCEKKRQNNQCPVK
jgi:peptide/nickel transport system substrate-binding protein